MKKTWIIITCFAALVCMSFALTNDEPIYKNLKVLPKKTTKAELDSVQTIQKEYWKVFWQQPEIAAEPLTPTQISLFPLLANILQTPTKEREHSQWQFGNPVKFVPTERAASRTDK